MTMHAMMSDRAARDTWERERILRGWPGDDAAATLAEARLVLAVASGAAAPAHAWQAPTRPAWARIYTTRSERANVRGRAREALREAIAAALPELDRLAVDSFLCDLTSVYLAAQRAAGGVA